jgi:hypothetical protein
MPTLFVPSLICKPLTLLPFIPSVRCFFVFFAAAFAVLAFYCIDALTFGGAIAANYLHFAVVDIAAH